MEATKATRRMNVSEEWPEPHSEGQDLGGSVQVLVLTVLAEATLFREDSSFLQDSPVFQCQLPALELAGHVEISPANLGASSTLWGFRTH